MRSPNTKIHVYRKTPGDLEWKLLSDLSFPEDIWVSEPFLLPIDENYFIMHIRSGEGTPFAKGSLWQIESEDGGKTWSEPQKLDVIGHAPYLHCLTKFIDAYLSSLLPSLTLISAFRLVDYETMTQKTAYMTSRDLGDSWSEPIIILECGEGECGYPSFVDLDKEHFFMVYYCDNAKTIKGNVYKY